VLGIPIELAAGVCLASLFGAAANTPLALTIMAVEILGGNVFPHVAIVAVVAYLLTGQRGIYPAQRLRRTKEGHALEGTSPSLRDFGG
jgi:H+/Cl- antiporter ClcA